MTVTRVVPLDEIGDPYAKPGSRAWAVWISHEMRTCLSDFEKDHERIEFLLGSMRREKGWESLTDRHGRPFESFEAFCREKPPFGLGLPPEAVDAVAAGRAGAGIVEVPIGDIVVTDRARKDVGNVLGLAESIRRLGLLHPVVLNSRRELVAGRRRLEAFRKLGRATIPARFVDKLDDAVAALEAERDENTCREPMTPAELVEVGRRLEALEKPKAAERKKGGKKLADGPSGNLPEGGRGQTRDKVAKALGVSGKTYEKAKQVVEAAEKEPEKFGDLPARMGTESVHAAHQELRRRTDPGEVLVPARAERSPAGTQTVTARVLPGLEPETRAVAVRVLTEPEPPQTGPAPGWEADDIASAIAGAGREYGATLDELAELTGLSRDRVEHIAAGVPATFAEGVLLAAAMGLENWQLLTDEGQERLNAVRARLDARRKAARAKRRA